MTAPTGLRAIVTGGTSGIGFETALALAGGGASVVITGRGAARGEAARRRILARHTQAELAFAPLDLASLASVRRFADAVLADQRPLDLLILNAGVMAVPSRQLTADGFELQLGVNHLGHFALAGWLLPALRRASGARLVAVSSVAHRRGWINLADLQSEARYSPMGAYSQSKLANLLFALEFARRSEAQGWGVCGLAAHPGWAATEIGVAGTRLGRPGLALRLLHPLLTLGGQSAASGAWPILFAATSPDAQCGGYYGPARWAETRGKPAPARISPAGQDASLAAALWDASEALTGVRFA